MGQPDSSYVEFTLKTFGFLLSSSDSSQTSIQSGKLRLSELKKCAFEIVMGFKLIGSFRKQEEHLSVLQIIEKSLMPMGISIVISTFIDIWDISHTYDNQGAYLYQKLKSKLFYNTGEAIATPTPLALGFFTK